MPVHTTAYEDRLISRATTDDEKELAATVERLDALLVASTERLEELRPKAEELEEKVSSLESRLSDTEFDHGNALKQVGELEAEVERLKEENAALEHRINQIPAS